MISARIEVLNSNRISRCCRRRAHSQDIAGIVGGVLFRGLSRVLSTACSRAGYRGAVDGVLTHSWDIAGVVDGMLAHSRDIAGDVDGVLTRGILWV